MDPILAWTVTAHRSADATPEVLADIRSRICRTSLLSGRILTPLVAHHVGLSDSRFVYMPIMMGWVLLSYVYVFFRRDGCTPLLSLGAAATIALSTPTTSLIHADLDVERTWVFHRPVRCPNLKRPQTSVSGRLGGSKGFISLCDAGLDTIHQEDYSITSLTSLY